MRSDIINGIMGKPYVLGAQGPDCFDCYSAARYLQKHLFGCEMPKFEMPSNSGRMAIAAVISVHPERKKWIEVDSPTDGCLVTMARNECGYHIGTWVKEDGGLIIHALENTGIVADTVQSLQTIGWRKFRFHIPA